jgi:hypothetical protein
MIRYALVGITLMMAGNAFGQGKDQGVLWAPRPLMSGEVPMPDRMVRSDIVVLGRVVAVKPKDVEAILSSASPYRLDYRIVVVKVNEVIHGPKELKELRLGFISPDQDRAVDKTGKAMPKLSPLDARPVKVGEDGLFFLRKHHQDTFFVNFLFFNSFLPSSDAPEFTKSLENARRLSKVLELPLEALKAENATNRFLASTMLINRYRLNGAKVGKLPEKAIDAEESKLILKTLAEADWKDVNEAISSSKYPPHPYRVFLQLGVTKTDGFDPPKNAPDFRETLKYTQSWLRDNQEKYRIQRFSQPAQEKKTGENVDPMKKIEQGADDAAEKKEIDRLNRYYPNGFHFVDTLRADGKILWITKEVVGGKVKAQRREIASLKDFKKEFRKANVNKEASIEVHVRFIRIEGATERAEAILQFLKAEGYKKAGAVSN